MKYELHNVDCMELDKVDCDLIFTDPPYPDYYVNEYKYFEGILDFLNRYKCRQFVFWSAKVNFPLDYTAIHIWNKKTGVGSQYERIFERNGHKNYKVFSHYLINSTVAAKYTGDTFTGHKSQKPVKLIFDILKYEKKSKHVFDPFMGSGSTGVVCKEVGKSFTGCEIDPDYFKIAEKRIHQASLQEPLF